MRCACCSSRLPEGANYCPVCGAAVGAAADTGGATRVAAEPAGAGAADAAIEADSEARFVSGWLFDGEAGRDASAAGIDPRDACEEAARAAEEEAAAEEALASLFGSDCLAVEACEETSHAAFGRFGDEGFGSDERTTVLAREQAGYTVPIIVRADPPAPVPAEPVDETVAWAAASAYRKSMPDGNAPGGGQGESAEAGRDAPGRPGGSEGESGEHAGTGDAADAAEGKGPHGRFHHKRRHPKRDKRR